MPYRSKAKILAYQKEYNQKHKARISVRGKKYNREHKDEISENKRRYYQENKARILADKKQHYLENKTEKKAYNKKYNHEHCVELAINKKEYFQSKAGKAAHSKADSKRRARKLRVEYETFDKNEIFERDGWRCQHCHKKVRPNGSQYHPLYPNLDHIVCLANGGTHTRQNTQLLCRHCNAVKHINDHGEQLRLFG